MHPIGVSVSDLCLCLAAGYQRLIVNATTLIVQPMNVTTLPAVPFVDANAGITLVSLKQPYIPSAGVPAAIYRHVS